MSAKNSYIALEIGGVKADIDTNGQVPSVTYVLEDEVEFQEKLSAASYDIELPATLVNDKIHNTLNDPSVKDGTASQQYDNFQDAILSVNGQEILIGKYLATKAIQQNRVPTKYQGKIYGLNGDWAIPMADKTILDFVNPRQHMFTLGTIQDSWNFDGTDEVKDYVYAPARYLKRFGAVPVVSGGDPSAVPLPLDDNVLINDLRPAMSIYWILWRGFKSAGYKIKSTFMDLTYYRRSVLPWTFGAFDFIDDTTWAPLKFVAIEDGEYYVVGLFDGYPQPTKHPAEGSITIDGGVKPGAFENSPGVFSYYNSAGTIPYLMAWNYLPAFNFGHVLVNLSVQVSWNFGSTAFGHARAEVHWYKNGLLLFTDLIVDASDVIDVGFFESFYEVEVDPGDYVAARIYVKYEGPAFIGQLHLNVEAFQLNFMKLTDNSTITLQNYPKLKNFKWLDLLRGEVDCFDLEVQTDTVKKEVTIEPMNDYVIDGVKYPGYFNRQVLDYSQKVDYAKENELELFSDYEREFDFIFRDDPNDGGLKKIQDRNQVIIGKGRYLLPERYKVETRAKENRFYSPVMHYQHNIFKSITGIAPQLIAIIPENISNTSADSAENIYNPKRAYYKGLLSGVGGWRFNGIDTTTLPFMFAVNYNIGGDTDPVFSYSDQFISGVIAQGWLGKFFIQRMALYRNGRRYNPINLKLNNNDVMNFLHRESIVIEGVEYFLMGINEYNPTVEDSTACTAWVFEPAGQRDKVNIFPSISSISDGNSALNSYDLKYWPHLLLPNDVSS